MWKKLLKMIRDLIGMSEPFIKQEKNKEKVKILNEALDELDTDGDGVPDVFDEFPEDPEKQ